MNDRIWVNPRQPQTLYLAQILMYLQGGLDLLFGLLLGLPPLFALIAVGKIAGAYGIANEKRWGYRLGVVAAIAPLALRALFLATGDTGVAFANPIGLLFDVALVALLLHEQSRGYQRIWFS